MRCPRSSRSRTARLLSPLLLPALLLLAAPSGAHGQPVDDEVGAGEVAHLLDRVLPRAQRVELRYLRHLGWRFVRDPGVSTVVVDGGHPGRHPTLAAAQAAGALTIRVPTAFDAAQARALGARLGAIADGIPSRLAYQHRLAPALKRAVARFERIEASGRYQFPKLFEFINSPFWGLRLPETAWTAVDGVYVAYGSSARALEEIWQRGGTAECYTGQWLAIFGAQYELYGRRWFERIFAPTDLQIGKPSAIKGAPIGQATRGARRYDYRMLVVPDADRAKDPWLALAEHGPLAFPGIVGVMQNSNRAGSQMNENWTLVDISPAAVEQIRRGGGTRFLNAQIAAVWTHLNAALPSGPLRHLAEVDGAPAAAVERILAQPAFAEVRVYVHPYGTTTFADLVRDKFPEDDTPPDFVVYRHGRESLLYRRYHRAWKDRCASGGPCR